MKSNLIEAIQRIYNEYFKEDLKKVEKSSDFPTHEKLLYSEIPKKSE